MAVKLSAQEISKILSNAQPASDFKIIVEEHLTSTNDCLLELVNNSKEPMQKTALLAEMQTAGKGRQGRSWVSVEGNILLSVYWPFKCELDKLYGLSLVVGIAIARVLQKNGLDDVQLKWPNDIYWQDCKMGGILIETKQNTLGVIDTIIGIGLNIVDIEQYANKIGQKCVALENALQHKVYRDNLIAQLLLELDNMLHNFIEIGFSAYIEEWRALDCKIASINSERDLLDKVMFAEKGKDGKLDFKKKTH